MTKLPNINNKAVQLFITYSNNSCSKQVKEQRLKLLESELLKQGIYIDDLFPMKQYKVLEHIMYCLSANGIIKTSIEHLSTKLHVSERTVSNCIKALKSTDQFLFTRLKTRITNNGKLVIIDKLSEHFSVIMSDVFNLDTVEYTKLYASRDLSENGDITILESENRTFNYINCLKSFKTSSLIINNSNSYTDSTVKSINLEPAISLDEQQLRLQTYATNQNQLMFFEFMKSLPLHTQIEQNLYKIALAIGSDATINEFIIAKDVLNELNLQLCKRSTTITTSIRSLFESMYKQVRKQRENVSKHEFEHTEIFNFDNTPVVKKVQFYNWLEERE